MERRKVPVWGFDEEAMRGWPPDLEPVQVTRPPREGAVVVYGPAAPNFQDEAERYLDETGCLPDAILYLPRGEEVPQDIREYFDAVVTEGEWDTLRSLLACPRRFEMIDMAADLPAYFLLKLDRPIEEVPVSDLPLPEEARQHLADCATCREIFCSEVRNWVWWYRNVEELKGGEP